MIYRRITKKNFSDVFQYRNCLLRAWINEITWFATLAHTKQFLSARLCLTCYKYKYLYSTLYTDVFHNSQCLFFLLVKYFYIFLAIAIARGPRTNKIGSSWYWRLEQTAEGVKSVLYVVSVETYTRQCKGYVTLWYWTSGWYYSMFFVKLYFTGTCRDILVLHIMAW